VLEAKYAEMAMRCAALDRAKKRFENIQKTAEKETEDPNLRLMIVKGKGKREFEAAQVGLKELKGKQ
jgi:hypothetical protein